MGNAQVYLGKEMDIESILSHFLAKRRLDIVEMDDIEYMYNTLGMGYDKWISMYDNYIVSKHRLVIHYYGLAHTNAKLYLGVKMDIESLLVNYLTKRKLDIVTMDDIEYMYNTLGMGYDKWISMYNDYLISKCAHNIPDNTGTINVLHVLLHRHLNRLYSWNY